MSETNPFPLAPVTKGSSINWTNFLELELAAFDKTYSVPYTYNYNLNIQRSLGSNLVAQIGYVGSMSHRLPSWYEGNPITSAGHTSCLADTSQGGCASSPYFDRYFPQYMTQTANYSGYPYYLTVGMKTQKATQTTTGRQADQTSVARIAVHLGLHVFACAGRRLGYGVRRRRRPRKELHSWLPIPQLRRLGL